MDAYHRIRRQKSIEGVYICSDMIDRMAILRVHVVPNAQSDSVAGEHGAAVKIKLSAPAVEKPMRRWCPFSPARMKLPRLLGNRKRILRYSVMILSAHSTSETKILGLPNLAPYSFKSASVTPLAREQAPHA